MAEKRLIDANALFERLSTLTMYITGMRAGKGVLNKVLTEYRKSFLRIVEEQPTVDAVEVVRWIPVTERLPKDFEHVLVYYEYFRYGEYNRLYRAIGTSYTFQGSWSGFVNGTSGWRDLKILAWMPLPEPPKEDAE